MDQIQEEKASIEIKKASKISDLSTWKDRFAAYRNREGKSRTKGEEWPGRTENQEFSLWNFEMTLGLPVGCQLYNWICKSRTQGTGWD